MKIYHTISASYILIGLAILLKLFIDFNVVPTVNAIAALGIGLTGVLLLNAKKREEHLKENKFNFSNVIYLLPVAYFWYSHHTLIWFAALLVILDIGLLLLKPTDK